MRSERLKGVVCRTYITYTLRVTEEEIRIREEKRDAEGIYTSDDASMAFKIVRAMKKTFNLRTDKEVLEFARTKQGKLWD